MPDGAKISLNPVQQEAVEHTIHAPLKVIAGAGTDYDPGALFGRLIHNVNTRFSVIERKVSSLCLVMTSFALIFWMDVRYGMYKCDRVVSGIWSPKLQ